MKLKDIVRTVAPALAGALGGPLAGTAVRVLSEKFLGKPDGTPEELETFLQTASPEQIVALKALDLEFKGKLLDAGIKIEEIEVADRSSARQMFMAAKDPTPSLLTAAVVVVWAAIQYLLFTGEAPEGSRELIARMLGTVDAALLTVMTFWFGSSRGSSEKNAMIDKLTADR